MHAAGTTEAISYFAGHLRLYEEPVRSRVEYDRGGQHRSSDDHGGQHPASGRAPGDADDFDPRAVRMARVGDGPELAPVGSLAGPIRSEPWMHGVPTPHHEAPLEAPILIPRSGGGGGGGDEGYGYAPGGDPSPDETILDLTQRNRMSDRDVMGHDGSDMRADDGQTLRSLIEAADGARPVEFQPDAATSQAYVALITSRDAAIAGGAAGGAHEVEAGRYVDGALSSEAGPAIPAWRAPGSSEAPAQTSLVLEGEIRLDDGPARIGLEVETGSNMAANSVLMRDVGPVHASMIVYGDWFRSDVIVQTNVLQNHDVVSLPGGWSAGAAEAGDRSVNIANFVTTGIETRWSGADGAQTWRVDMIHGDFYDVSVVMQLNELVDGDWISQTTFDGYGMVHGGGNLLANVASLHNLASQYDLIVVTGSVHDANWIFQSNILIDDDWITLTTDGAGGGVADVSGAGNLLVNEAVIARYGRADAQALDDEIRSFAERLGQLGDGEHELSGPLGALGNGQPLDVLFIDGDLFNLRVVDQRNVVSDSDDARQALTSQDGTAPSSSVSTGANVLINSAAIVSVGSGSDKQYVGGKTYEQSVLVQAEIVSTQPAVTFGDTRALVSEIIAFTGDDAAPAVEEDAGLPAPATAASGYDAGHILA